MSLLELQQRASELSFHDRAALLLHLKRSLSDTEREALQLEEASMRLSELQNGATERVAGDEWYGRGNGA